MDQSSSNKVILSETDNLASSWSELSKEAQPNSRIKHLEAIRGSLLAKWYYFISKPIEHLVPFLLLVLSFIFVIEPVGQLAHSLKLPLSIHTHVTDLEWWIVV